MNSSAPTQAEDESTDTIKFSHSVDGVLEFNSGHTVFSDLLMIGAFASTKGHNHNSEHLWSEYPTDMDGLKLLEAKTGEIVYELSDTISSLGMMLAYVDTEVGPKHLSNCAWLVAGLGELLTQLVRENQEITNSLLVLSKQANVIPFSRAEKAQSKA